MSAVLALRAAQAAGAHIIVRDENLVILSQGALPDDVLAGLRKHRDQLVRMLLEPSPEAASAYKPWPNPQQPRVWYRGHCRLCGRPMHDGDYVCPVPKLRLNFTSNGVFPLVGSEVREACEVHA